VPVRVKGSTLASWLSWDESTSRRIRESDPPTRQLPDASNSDYNGSSTHATKTYHQLHESYPKDKLKNNDYHASKPTSPSPTQNLHEKRNNPMQKQQTTLRQLHETYTKPNKQPKATLEIADQKASQQSHNLCICQTRRRLVRSFVNPPSLPSLQFPHLGGGLATGLVATRLDHLS
jgi:hypothetical protein